VGHASSVLRLFGHIVKRTPITIVIIGPGSESSHLSSGANGVGESRRRGRLAASSALGNSAATWHDFAVTRKTASAQHLDDLVRLRRVRDRIDREYAQPLDVEALARSAKMSAGHLSRQFRLAYGESPYAYLMTRRIERAMALLRRGGLSVTEVCFAVGCSSMGTFSSRFAELVGMPPSTYRRQAAGATAGMPSCVAKQVTRPVRNREAPLPEPQLT
jgi:AraC-like DNA-binding protein